MTSDYLTRIYRRESNMELARIIAMLLITISHFVLILGLFVYPKDEFISASDISSPLSYWGRILIYSLSTVGVNLFVLISGYFKIRLTWKSLLHFILLCVFYNALVYLARWFFFDYSSVAGLVKVFIVSKTVNWFFRSYFALMLLCPLLNAGLEALDIKAHRKVVILLFLLNCISGFIFHNENPNGYNAFHFLFIYVVGNWIRRDEWLQRQSFLICFALYCLFSIINAGIALGVLRFTAYPIRMVFFYNNPLVVLASVCLLMSFQKIPFKSRLVNVIASTVVSALFIQHILFLFPNSFIQSLSFPLLVALILGIFVIAFFIEYPRKYLTEALLNLFSKKVRNLSVPIVS